MTNPVKVSYDPEEFPSLSLKVDAAMAASNFVFKFHEGDSKDISIRADILVSDEDLLDRIDVVSRGDEDGCQHFIVNAPKFSMPNKCVRVDIEITVPKRFTYFRDLRVAYVAGSIKFASGFEKVHYGTLFVGAVSSDMVFNHEVRADKVNLDVVSGGVEGRFSVKKIFQSSMVRGDVKAHVKVKKEDEVKIMITTALGDIKLDVSKQFAGSFYAGNLRGDVGVVGDDVELDVDKNHRKQGVHIPKGVDEKDAKSKIRATTIKGDVEVNFV